MADRLPVVVALGPVDPALVTGVLDGHCRFVPDPGDAELAVAAGAIVRAAQNGIVRTYGLFLIAGAVGLALYFLIQQS